MMRSEVHIDEALKIAAKCIFTVDSDMMHRMIERDHGRGSMILALRALAGAYSRSRDVCKRLKGAKMKTFDFNNNGPVPAHKHPNGGGWVADTARVDDTAYVGPRARVYDKAQVSGDARIDDAAEVCGAACVFSQAQVYEAARVYGKAKVYDAARVFCKAQVFEDAKVHGDADVYGMALVHGEAKVHERVKIAGNAIVRGRTRLYGAVQVLDAVIEGNAVLGGVVLLCKNAHVKGLLTITGDE